MPFGNNKLPTLRICCCINPAPSMVVASSDFLKSQNLNKSTIVPTKPKNINNLLS
jgi:hypothetical protein